MSLEPSQNFDGYVETYLAAREREIVQMGLSDYPRVHLYVPWLGEEAAAWLRRHAQPNFAFRHPVEDSHVVVATWTAAEALLFKLRFG